MGCEHLLLCPQQALKYMCNEWKTNWIKQSVVGKVFSSPLIAIFLEHLLHFYAMWSKRNKLYTDPAQQELYSMNNYTRNYTRC